MHWLRWEPLCEPNFMRFCIKSSTGPRVKLASCKSALNPLVVYSTDRSKAVVPVLVLLFVALWFILRGDLLYVFPCVILFLCFWSFLLLRLPRLRGAGVGGGAIGAFRTFVRYVLVWIFCRFPLPLWVWEGPRFVIVALPGLFSYLFLRYNFFLFNQYARIVLIIAVFAGRNEFLVIKKTIFFSWMNVSPWNESKDSIHSKQTRACL